ncbi:MAG TPA: hypothetical protein PKJ99_06630 [Thermoanaerobaculales bacterium]|nr:hypothetical protein [Thermoanaerobaculales bacterium]
MTDRGGRNDSSQGVTTAAGDHGFRAAPVASARVAEGAAAAELVTIMRFDSLAAVRELAGEANEQNLDRLAAERSSTSAARHRSRWGAGAARRILTRKASR